MTIKLKDLNKIEFWIATLLYAFAILLLLGHPENQVPWRLRHRFDDAGIKFSFLSSFFLPELLKYSILYVSFLLLNFCVVPSLFAKKDIGWNVFFVVGLLLFTTVATGISYTYSRAWVFAEFDHEDEVYRELFFRAFTYSAWLILIIALYTSLKKLILYIIENKDLENAGNFQMKMDIIYGTAIWFAGFLLWAAGSGSGAMIIFWTFIVMLSVGILVYSINELIPKIKTEGGRFKHFLWRIFLTVIVLWVPIGFIAFLLIGDGQLIFLMLILYLPTQLIIIAPLAWHLYKKRNENTAEIRALKSKLGKSDANLSFLKSQINPHFLFNALNTLYGTALQEKAERTGEGIQKLGDMMRFMLQENMEDKITLTRDIEYLNNYISLQKLRTSASSQITIETQIEDRPNMLQISPMLLIPFVENAFKHGISLQHPSHIRIILQVKEKALFLDVHNSIHVKADNDPEKLKSGIGLQNVKQRLALLYPGKHELLIRESALEFFIHLTIQLD